MAQINASIDGTSYNDINKIVVGGKNILLSAIDSGGGDLPANVSEVKYGTFTLESDKTSGNYDVAHGCSGIPSVIIVWSDFRTRYTSSDKPVGTTMIEYLYNALSGTKGATSVGTSYEGNANAGSVFYTPNIANDGEGMIIAVDSTNFTIKAHSTRRIGGGLKYEWLAICTV